MKLHSVFIFIGAALVAAAPTGRAQDALHPAQAAVGAAEVAQCAQAQALVTPELEAAGARLEMARQTNSAAAMRAAIDALDTVLRNVRAQLAPCSQMSIPAPATDKPAATPRGAAPAASTQPAAPAGQSMANMPGHNMATIPAPAGQKPAATPRRAAPAASTQAAAPKGQDMANMPGHNMATMSAPATANADAGHVMTTVANPAARLADLMCQPAVDPKTAPRATYKGKAYYFCSTADRDLFLKAPAKYLQQR